MKESFACITRCFHENTNGNVNTGTSDLHSRQEHMWWQVHSFDNTNVVTKPRSHDITGELESFTFADLTGEHIHMLMIFASWINITDAMKRRMTRELNHREQDSTSQNFRKLLRSLQTNCGVQPDWLNPSDIDEVFNTSIQKFSSALRADEYKESVV